MLSLLWPWVQSLGRELRSCKLCSVAKIFLKNCFFLKLCFQLLYYKTFKPSGKLKELDNEHVSNDQLDSTSDFLLYLPGCVFIHQSIFVVVVIAVQRKLQVSVQLTPKYFSMYIIILYFGVEFTYNKIPSAFNEF